MRQGIWRSSPAIAIAAIALFAALGGSVYAAKKRARIDGKAIRAKSLPGNRLKPRSIAANRLKPGVLRGSLAAAPLTGAEIAEPTLGEVPSAAHATTADTARSAVDAETATYALSAIEAQTVNGHGAGCLPGTRAFAGACWETGSSAAASAPAAAAACAARGGALPEALQLAAFAAEQGISLHAGDEWSGDVTNVSGLEVYGVVTVSAAGELDFKVFSNTRAYRCVVPLLR